ncbi:MAG: cell division protein FtsZ [Bacteroidota bacterium]|nr:cell division protein FtsZ [Bacteroidota bacterium]
MKFDLPKDQSSIIKVIGVGGGGSNAVNHMYRQGIKGVDFIVCNTDHQALDISPVPVKIQLGQSLTEGRGAGSIPDVGKNAAIENLDDIKEILEKNTKMVFVTAGMGGGTGTGAAPVIAQAAKELGILTVGIVTVPFTFEGRKRRTQAEMGLDKMRDCVDTLLVINNDKLREKYGNLSLINAFEQADDVLAIAAKGIAEVISVTGQINVDFNDVNTVMKDSGVAIMGSSEADGEDRALKCVESALASPLLNDNNIKGAKYVLLNITYGKNAVLMDEISEITDYIQEEAGSTADVIWGHGYDENLEEKLCVTIIATGFKTSPNTGLPEKEPQKKKIDLEDSSRPTMITQPIESPIEPYSDGTSDSELREEDSEPFVVKKFNLEDESEFTKPVTIFSEEFPEKKPEIDNVEPSSDGKIRFFLEDNLEDEEQSDSDEEQSWNQSIEDKQTISLSEPSVEENKELTKQRLDRIQKESQKMKSPLGISEMENEPAYKRRNIKLDEDFPKSDDSNVSRFSLGNQDENGNNSGLSDNNSFLHDNVD